MKKEIRSLRNTLEFRSQFLEDMSHQLKTPLNGIISIIELLKNKQDINDDLKKYFSIIDYSSSNLINIVQDILDFSKIEEGKLNLKIKNENIPNLLFGIIESNQKRITENGNILKTNFCSNVPEFALIDKGRIIQIVSKLLINANRFTKNGTIYLNSKVIDNKLSFEVIDTGCGFAEKNKQPFLNDFSQLKNNYENISKDIGLGLSICKQLVTVMGGDIHLSSQIDQGTIIGFEIPLNTIPKGSNQTKYFPLDLHLLITEDKFINQKILKLILKNFSCTCDIANNGQEAVDLYHPSKHDLILMDIRMPIMDGKEATKLLKEKYGEEVTIIGLSAESMEIDKRKYINLGMMDYIAKPISIQLLYDKLTDFKKI